MIRLLISALLILLTQGTYAQGKGKCYLSIVDSMMLSPAAALTFYWWDPYHLHSEDKILAPDGVKDDTYLQQPPPYTYRFKLKKGEHHLSIHSCFLDSILISIDLQSDSTIYFQQLVKDFYQLSDSSFYLFDSLKIGDKITVHVAKMFDNDPESLRLDFEVNEEIIPELKLVNRNEFSAVLNNKELENLKAQLFSLEKAARLLKDPGEQSYVVTLRKNRQVIEYKGRLGASSLNAVFSKLKAIAEKS